MKTFREYLKEMEYRPGDRESSNVEDKRDSIEGLIAGFDKPKPPSIVDRARQLGKEFHPSDVKPANYMPPETINKQVSDTFQKVTTPQPHNRMDYAGKIVPK